MNHLQRRIPAEPVTEGPPRRGCGQRLEREQEHEARRHAVDVGKLLVERGWNWADTADLLGVPARTLRDWRLDLDRRKLRVVSLGRPLKGAKPEQRNQVIRFIDELGPGIGLPTLRDSFPDFARAELEDILRRYRRVWRKRNRQPLHVLHWTQPGAVWAIDFHGPRPPIDGLYPHLLAVRDLASGQQLLWLPVADVCASTVRQALTSLFVVHGAPLVLKSDNGSAFIAEGMRELAENFAVKILYSPPRMPSYNGSIEAGIGSLTTRTEQHAARHGRPGHWTWDDATAARLEANATARPKGPLGPSPDQLWQARTPIAPHQRERFARMTERCSINVEAAQGWPHDNASQRAQDREAISQALVELGYLTITRRSIPLPIPTQKAASIT